MIRRWIDRALLVVLVVALAVVAIKLARRAWPGPSTPANPAVPVRVIDGDTLALGDRRIRLHGIDAPEVDQHCTDALSAAYPCGEYSKAALEALVIAREVSCETLDLDRYGREVARCTAGSIDLSNAIVVQGWAIAYRKYSLDYVPAEQRAREQRVGLWAGTFTPPSEYRRARP